MIEIKPRMVVHGQLVEPAAGRRLVLVIFFTKSLNNFFLRRRGAGRYNPNLKKTFFFYLEGVEGGG